VGGRESVVLLQGVYKYFYKRLIRPIFTIRSSPHSIALGMAFGLFVALTPTVGFQMLIVVVIGTLIKANRIIAVVVVWISNPITFIPMYYGYYYLGGLIVGVDLWTFDNFSMKFNEFLSTGESQGYGSMVKEFGSEIFTPLWVGSLIIALAAAIPAYPLTRYALKRAKQKRQALWKEARARHAARKEAERENARKGDGSSEPPRESKAHSAPSKEKLNVIVIAAFSSILFAGCARGDDAVDPQRPQSPPESTILATLGLDGDHPLFVEIADHGSENLHYAFLRIYNFSDRPYELGDVKNSLTVEIGSEKRNLEPLEEIFESDPSRTIELLSLATPAGTMHPGHWTRIPLAYEGPALGLEDAKILWTSENGDTILPLREVKVVDWDRFVRDPSTETLNLLKKSLLKK